MKTHKNTVVITGGNFQNKGAQAMLFAAISEIRKKDSECEILVVSPEEMDDSKYSFKHVDGYDFDMQIYLSDVPVFYETILMIKNIFKRILKIESRKYDLEKIRADWNRVRNADVFFDISGYGIGSNISYEGNEAFLDNIRLAKKANAVMYVLPQSLGPFVFPEKYKKTLINLLQYPRTIYVREKKYMNILVDEYGLTNIRYSYDLVLQNKEVDLKYIFANQSSPRFKSCMIGTSFVGIIPNSRCMERGNSDDIFKTYKALMDYILSSNKRIILFRHSIEDLPICEELKRLYIKDDRVVLKREDFNCMELEEIIGQLDYCVCSRFHGIVHSYKMDVPCVVLGWANKYAELMGLVNQEKYLTDLYDSKDIKKELMEKVMLMDQNVDIERRIIKEKMIEIQNQSIFDNIEIMGIVGNDTYKQ